MSLKPYWILGIVEFFKLLKEFVRLRVQKLNSCSSESVQIEVIYHDQPVQCFFFNPSLVEVDASIRNSGYHELKIGSKKFIFGDWYTCQKIANEIIWSEKRLFKLYLKLVPEENNQQKKVIDYYD